MATQSLTYVYKIKNLEQVGDALDSTPGQEMLEIQVPVIGYHDILTTIRSGGPCWDLPETTAEDGRAARIRELAEQGLSEHQIALEVFGYAGGAAYTAVKQATTTQMPVQATVSGRVG